MKTVKVIVESSTKIKFIVLQVLIFLLVAATLVSFSDITLPPFKGRYTGKADNKAVAANPSIAKQVAENPALQIKLEQSEKLNLDKQTRITELEKELIVLQTNKKNTAASDNQATELSATTEQLKFQYTNALNDKETKIRELETRIVALQNQKNNNATPPENKAIVQKLRSDLQKSEARNVLLEKLNNDLKKNNEYLSALNKSARSSGN